MFNIVLHWPRYLSSLKHRLSELSTNHLGAFPICTLHFDLLKFWQMGIGLNCYNSDKNYLCLQLWSMMVCCIEYIHRNGSIELEWVIHNSPLYQTHSHYCLYHHHNSHHQQMKDCYNLKLLNNWNLHRFLDFATCLLFYSSNLHMITMCATMYYFLSEGYSKNSEWLILNIIC